MTHRRPQVVAVLILVIGALIEIRAWAPACAALMDWLVGAAFVLAALRRRPSPAELWLGMGTAGAWFAATLAPQLDGGPAAAAGIATLAYRGVLLHWIVRHALGAVPGRLIRATLVVGYIASVIPALAGSLATSAVALILAAGVLGVTSRRPADTRETIRRAAALLAVLSMTWGAAALGVLPVLSGWLGPLVLLATAWHLSGAPVGQAGLDDAITRLAVELAPTDRPATPLSAALRQALADPELRILFHEAGTGWTDDAGRPVDEPPTDDHRVTDLTVPDGGRVVLVHGPGSAGDSAFAWAAAAAAALGLDRLRLDAQLRREGTEIRRSATRLTMVDDEERRALAEVLHEGPAARLRLVRESWAESPGRASLVAELDRILAEIDRIARGLAPRAAAPGELRDTLQLLCGGVGIPVEAELDQDLARLPAATAAVVFFVVSESLTNIARHSSATAATVVVRLTDEVLIEVVDDGRGGAELHAGRGLQGLADRVRVAGGRLIIDSPPGGPTRILARIPGPSAPPPG